MDMWIETMKVSHSHHWMKLIGVIVFISLISGTLLYKYTKKTGFHGDESGWISSGYYYSGLLLNHDFRWEKWSTNCGPWGRLNPQVGKWLIGIPLKLYSERKGGREFSAFYNFNKSFQENKREGKVPPQDILSFARISCAVFGVLCCLLVFVIGYSCYNLWIGLIGAMLLLANKVFVISVTRAMIDVHYNLFLLFLCAASILFLKPLKQPQMLWVSSLCGVFTALACSVKITGVMIGVLMFMALIVYKGFMARLEKRKIVSYFIVFFFSSLFMIYLLNPYYWPSYKEINAKALIEELKIVSEDLPNLKIQKADPIGENIKERYPQLSNLSHLLEFPRLFLTWDYFMNRLATGASGVPFEYNRLWQGNRVYTLHKTLFLEYSSLASLSHIFSNKKAGLIYVMGGIEGVFLCIGVMLCCIRIYTLLRERKVAFCMPPLLFFLVNYFFILIFQNVNFDRYYLPTIIAGRIIVAF